MDGPTMTDFCSWACADQNRKTSAPYAGSFDWSLKKKHHQCLNINGNKQPAFLQSFAIFCSFIGLQKLTEVHFVWSVTVLHIKYILLSTLLKSYKTTKLHSILVSIFLLHLMKLSLFVLIFYILNIVTVCSN